MKRAKYFVRVVTLVAVGLISTFQTSAVARPRAYVANAVSNDVSVIDLETNQEVDRIAVGLRPFGVAVSPDGSFVYVANQDSNTVSIIDTSNDHVANTVQVGTSPYGVAFTPNGALAYVANNYSGDVSEINVQTQQVTATIAVADNPWELVVSTDGERVYVSKNGGVSVSVINVQTHSVTEIPGNSYAASLAGDYAYFTVIGIEQLKVLNTTTNEWVGLLQPVAMDAYDLTATSDGTRVWVSGTRGTISVVDTTNPAAPTLITTIDLGIGRVPREAAFSPDPRFAYVALAGANSVGVISTTTYTLMEEIPVGQMPQAIDIAP
jgi:YVTN family beta-propeller protein